MSSSAQTCYPSVLVFFSSTSIVVQCKNGGVGRVHTNGGGQCRRRRTVRLTPSEQTAPRRPLTLRFRGVGSQVSSSSRNSRRFADAALRSQSPYLALHHDQIVAAEDEIRRRQAHLCNLYELCRWHVRRPTAAAPARTQRAAAGAPSPPSPDPAQSPPDTALPPRAVWDGVRRAQFEKLLNIA